MLTEFICPDVIRLDFHLPTGVRFSKKQPAGNRAYDAMELKTVFLGQAY